MYPSTHLLAESHIQDRLREADLERTARAAQSRESTPRWWRLRSSTIDTAASDARRVADPLHVGLKRLETPTWSG
jgi:hypothetical protein